MSLYRLSVTMSDGTTRDDEYRAWELADLAGMEHFGRNLFNSLGGYRDGTVQKLAIVRDNTKELRAVARAKWHRENRT